MKDWVGAGAALAGVALLELQGLTAPVASDAAVAALQPVFFGISYLRIAEAGARLVRRRRPGDGGGAGRSCRGGRVDLAPRRGGR